jgi:hypothetical protein
LEVGGAGMTGIMTGAGAGAGATGLGGSMSLFLGGRGMAALSFGVWWVGRTSA